MPPAHPTRLRYFLYGCANESFEDEVKLAGGKLQRKQARALAGS